MHTICRVGMHSNTQCMKYVHDIRSCPMLLQARRSGLRAETVELRTLFFQLLEVVLDSCSSSCSRERPHAKFYFAVSCKPPCLNALLFSLPASV